MFRLCDPPWPAPGEPGFFSAGLFAAELFPFELPAAELPAAELFGCRAFCDCDEPAFAGAGCGLDAPEFGATEFAGAFAVPAPETLAGALPAAFPAISAATLAWCVLEYQKYDPAPAAINTTAAVAAIILFLPERLRSAAFAESN